MQVCPHCGEENPDRFRLCGICGTKLAPEEIAPEVRKTVSVVFCDLKGSTTLGESLDTELLREVLNTYFNEMRTVLERHGGSVEKYIGDAIMAVFGLPKAHEDDALRAVRAAHEMKLTLAKVNDRLEDGWGVRLENRTGVNTGEVVAGDVSAGQRLVTGDTVNTAARLEQAAPALEVLIGEPTYRLVKDAVEAEPVEPLELKGKAEPVPAYRLLSVTREEGLARRQDTPMVGRSEELQKLADALERAKAECRAQLVTVIAPAGVGKSRLLKEVLDRIGDEAVCLRGRCLSYGEGITFWPLAEVVRAAAGILDDDTLEGATAKLAALAGSDAPDVAERVAAAIGLSDAVFPVQETFWAARRLLEIVARNKPAVVVIDDIHWAEETFLDLLGYLAESAEARLLLLCSARPDLLEEHAEWIQERDTVRRIILEPLSEEESSNVVENLLGTRAMDEAARARIIGAAQGNPLFVEQMLSMLIDDGSLAQDDDGRWILLSRSGTLAIPPSISALLTARLDRLGPTERAVIERGSVIGQTFFRGAVEELSPDPLRSYVGPSLATLVRKEFIHPHESAFAGQEAYRFPHVLVRDAAYRGLLKRTRAELHERFVDWLENMASDRLMEYEEIRGYHLEQAFLILRELAPADEHASRLGARGAEYLSRAGQRALARGDMPAAANLLQRAAELLSAEDPGRPRLLIDAAEALIEIGEFPLVEKTLAAAIEGASALGDRASRTTAQIVRLQLGYFKAEGDRSEEKIAEEVERAIPEMETLGNHVGLARAWRLLANIHVAACRYGAAEEATRKMLEHAGLAGDAVMQARALPALALCALYGPMPVLEAIRRCEEILTRTGGDRKAEALTLGNLAHLEAMQGRFDRARQLYRRSRAALQELGWKFHAALTSLESGPVEMLAGDPGAAESELRRDYEVLARMGDRALLPTTAGVLAEALYVLDRDDEAEAFTRIGEEKATADDLVSQVLWRSVRAKVLARAGRPEEGETLAREAVELVRRSEEPDSQGEALMNLAEVLAVAGKRMEARRAVQEALGLFEAKGNLVSARRARAVLASDRREG